MCFKYRNRKLFSEEEIGESFEKIKTFVPNTLERGTPCFNLVLCSLEAEISQKSLPSTLKVFLSRRNDL